MKQIGTILNEIRQDKKLRLIDVAKKLNVCLSTIGHWENNRRDVGVVSLLNLCSIFNLEIKMDEKEFTIKDIVSNKIHTVISNNKLYSTCNVVYKEENYQIVESYKYTDNYLSDKIVIDFKKSNSNCERGYSIIHNNSMLTPYDIELWFKDLDSAKVDLEKYLLSIKFPILHKATINTGGKIVFQEQVVLILKSLNYKNGDFDIRNFGKRKIEHTKDLQLFCENIFGSEGDEFFNIIIEGIRGSYKKILYKDYVKGYEGFLENIIKSTNNELRNIHQKCAFLGVLDNTMLSKHNPINYDDYDKLILDIMDRDVFKYGFPEFRNKVIESINKSLIHRLHVKELQDNKKLKDSKSKQ